MSELNIRDLHVKIGEKEILKGVSLSVAQRGSRDHGT